jgi:hypothetical protein
MATLAGAMAALAALQGLPHADLGLGGDPSAFSQLAMGAAMMDGSLGMGSKRGTRRARDEDGDDEEEDEEGDEGFPGAQGGGSRKYQTWAQEVGLR